MPACTTCVLIRWKKKNFFIPHVIPFEELLVAKSYARSQRQRESHLLHVRGINKIPRDCRNGRARARPWSRWKSVPFLFFFQAERFTSHGKDYRLAAAHPTHGKLSRAIETLHFSRDTDFSRYSSISDLGNLYLIFTLHLHYSASFCILKSRKELHPQISWNFLGEKNEQSASLSPSRK